MGSGVPGDVHQSGSDFLGVYHFLVVSHFCLIEKKDSVLGVIERSFSRVPLSDCFLFLLDRQEKFCVFVYCVCVSCYGVTLTR